MLNLLARTALSLSTRRKSDTLVVYAMIAATEQIIARRMRGGGRGTRDRLVGPEEVDCVPRADLVANPLTPALSVGWQQDRKQQENQR